MRRAERHLHQRSLLHQTLPPLSTPLLLREVPRQIPLTEEWWRKEGEGERDGRKGREREGERKKEKCIQPPTYVCT